VSLIEKFQYFFTNIVPLPKKSHFLIAVSGGIDSVVLCHLCKKADLDFSIAHCNFGLRGEESTRDEFFVTQLAELFQVPFFLKHFDTKTFVDEHRLSIQEAARKLRYDWFEEIMEGKIQESGYDMNRIPDFLLTAHHLNDNVETVVMNFFKGTGISGLRGIQLKNGKIIRPLLYTKRREIVDYANENKLSWVHDSSNDTIKYTRNYFRHTVIPVIEKVFPEAVNNVSQNIQRFSEIEVLYQQAIELHKKKLMEYKGNEVHIPVIKLLKSTPIASIIYEIIKEFGFGHKQVNEVIRLVKSESGRYMNSSTHRILHNRNWLIISPLQAEDSGIIVLEEGQEELIFGKQKIQVTTIDSKITINKESNIALLDARLIQYPLLIRKWKQGDYFYPLGMPKKKKLSRFFIDQKLSNVEKEEVWVVESGKRIAWIIGLRIDDRFKITPSTSRAIQLKIQKI
jgi:tRNA(Ile)-lysidine synthase